MKMLSLLILTLLLFGCGQPTLPPGEFEVDAALSQHSLHVGDATTLTLTARHPAGSTICFPTLGKSKEIVVRGRSFDTSELSGDLLKTKEVYQITSLRVGDWQLFTQPALCTFADGTQKTQLLPVLVLKVQSTLNETNVTRLSDIKGVVKPPLRIGRIAWVMLLIAVLAIIAGLLTRFFRRRKQGETALIKPGVPPEVIAAEALAALRNKRWVPEPFFTELSLILRTYLENRFNLNAPESTTEELTRTMAHDDRLQSHEQQTLRTFLTQADLVKFSRAGAEKEVMRTAFQTVEDFVAETVQRSDSSDLSDSLLL